MVDFAKMLQQKRESRENDSPTGIPGKQYTTQVSISIAGSDYAVSFGYDKALLQKLKDAVPESDRAWHPGRKVWLIVPEAIQQAAIVIEKHIGQAVVVPPVDQLAKPEVIEKTFLLEYLGTTKNRGPRKTAYGFAHGEWSVEMPEDVLRGFFEGREVDQKPDGLQTLYQVLCVFEKAEPDQIKKAYKRLALHHHPDVCKEEGAEEMFIKINEAYKVLIDPEKRKRYDAGLYFERESKQQSRHGSFTWKGINVQGYRSPLRCGQITARGTVRLMRFVVSEILKWDDVIKDSKVMSSTWPKGADTFQILWV